MSVALLERPTLGQPTEPQVQFGPSHVARLLIYAQVFVAAAVRQNFYDNPWEVMRTYLPCTQM